MVLNDNPQPIDTHMRVSHKKRWLLVGVAAILLIATAVASLWMVRKANDDKNGASPQKVAVSHVCTPAIIRKANAPLAASDQVALAPVVDNITALKDYDRDPNCLYIVLQYDLVTGDAKASSDAMSKLDRVYDPVVGFSDVFTVSLISVKALRENVAFLTESAKQSKEDQKLGDERTAQGSDAADKFQQEHHK